MSKHINSSGIALNIRINICSINQYTINLLKDHIAFIATVKQSACPIGMIEYASLIHSQPVQQNTQTWTLFKSTSLGF